MKKFMMFAAAAIVAVAANAQNPDALKQVKAAQKYSEANEIMKTQAESMTPAERAQAYNKLVDLAISESQKAEEAVVKAQLAKNKEEETTQSAKAGKSAYNAVKAACECDKADNQPNEKGQVKPKFRSKNQGRIVAARNSLINPALAAYNSKDYASAQKYFGAFVESRKDPLFTGYDFSKETNYGQIAYYAGLSAYFNQDFKKAKKYAEISLEQKDTTVTSDAITLVTGSLEGMVKNGQIDSTKYAADVKKLYKEFPDNQVLFGKIVGLYQDMGDNAAADKLLTERLKQNPNDIMALAYLAQNAQNASKWDDAISNYEKALAVKADFIQCRLNLAVCYLTRGANLYDSSADAKGVVPAEAKAKAVADFQKAKSILEEVKAQDPDQLQVKWQYQMQRVDYALDQVK